jgi:hypothetical protein
VANGKVECLDSACCLASVLVLVILIGNIHCVQLAITSAALT